MNINPPIHAPVLGCIAETINTATFDLDGHDLQVEGHGQTTIRLNVVTSDGEVAARYLLRLEKTIPAASA